MRQILVLKTAIQVCLVVIALGFFGRSAFNRYQAKKIVVTTFEREEKVLPSPAVTVCPSNQQNNGFPRSQTLVHYNDTRVAEICGGTEGEDIVNCVENATFSLGTAVMFTMLGRAGKMIPPDRNKWISDFTDTQTGMCFSLNTSINMEASQRGVFLIGLNPKNAYKIFVHDPNMFIVNFNSLMPIKVIIKSGGRVALHELIIVQHDNLDVPSKPCNPDTSYKFSVCIKEAFSREIGCKLPWDRRTGTGQPVCRHLAQYRSL